MGVYSLRNKSIYFQKYINFERVLMQNDTEKEIKHIDNELIVGYTKTARFPVYSENPSTALVQDKLAKKLRPMKTPKAEGMVGWINDQTGQVVKGGVLFEEVFVDNQTFIKIFADNIKHFWSMDKSGQRLFEVLMLELRYEDDELYFTEKFAKAKYQISATTYHRGIKNLVENNIIYNSAKGSGWFYTNMEVFYKGNRLTKVQSYVRRTTKKIDHPNQLAMNFDEETQNDTTSGS